MLNRDGITKTSYSNQNQILAFVEPQVSVGCIVPQSLGAEVGSKKIAKAGTPIKIDLGNINTAVADGSTDGNAVLLHNVDVTDGAANGTALLFGFVNINRLESDVASKVTAGTKVGDVQFLKV